VSGDRLAAFLHGALAMASWVAGMFFLRFWRSSRDRLFVYFVLAFWLLAIGWAALTFLRSEADADVSVYLIRLLAFVLIIIGVVDKNRRAR
jgi:hypothetical protein